MAPGNGGQVNDNIAALVPANDILPVGNGQLIAIGQTQPGPDLRLLPEGKQALGAAQKQEGCQYRQKNPHGSAVQAVSYTHLDVYKRQLLDATDGRTYSDDRTVRLATLHLLI